MSQATPIKDRERMTDQIAEVMHQQCPSWTIDTLLTWPDKAQAMARAVLKRLGRRATSETIHEVLRCALSSRKRGDLRRDRV